MQWVVLFTGNEWFISLKFYVAYHASQKVFCFGKSHVLNLWFWHKKRGTPLLLIDSLSSSLLYKCSIEGMRNYLLGRVALMSWPVLTRGENMTGVIRRLSYLSVRRWWQFALGGVVEMKTTGCFWELFQWRNQKVLVVDWIDATLIFFAE